MSFPNNNQCIHCDVESCELDSIKVAPRCGCHSGDCDESLCASYHAK